MTATTVLAQVFPGSPDGEILKQFTSEQQAAIWEILNLDLEPIAFKLSTAEYDQQQPDMTLAEADTHIIGYRQFLVLRVISHPEQVIVPTKKIDQVWHCHILDTYKYAEDCSRIFGRFVHHYPYFGMYGEQDHRDLKTSFNNTMRLYEQWFGSAPVSAVGPYCDPACSDDLVEGRFPRPRPARVPVAV